MKSKVLIRSGPKPYTAFPQPNDASDKIEIGPLVAEIFIFEIVDDDGRRTDAGPWVYYKLTYEPLAQVS